MGVSRHPKNVRAKANWLQEAYSLVNSQTTDKFGIPGESLFKMVSYWHLRSWRPEDNTSKPVTEEEIEVYKEGTEHLLEDLRFGPSTDLCNRD